MNHKNIINVTTTNIVRLIFTTNFPKWAYNQNKKGSIFTRRENKILQKPSAYYWYDPNILYEDLPIIVTNQPFDAHQLIKAFWLPQTRVV